eukprot:Skav227652  [mRNA]  locus=scaffold58:469247:472812:+ [translate_table: standard]
MEVFMMARQLSWKLPASDGTPGWLQDWKSGSFHETLPEYLRQQLGTKPVVSHGFSLVLDPSYLNACKVECCDASTQCVFEEKDASGIVQSGYYDQDGPSAFCTGGATRMSPSLLLLFLLGWQVLPDWRCLLRSKYLMAVVLLLCSCNLQGCSLFIPSHREADYLVQYEFVPEGLPETAAALNSCRSAVAGDKVCSGRGQCKPWGLAPLKVDTSPATYTAFCECDKQWADPECGTRRKSQMKAFLLSLFLGIFGIDRFYLGFFYTGLPVSSNDVMFTLRQQRTWQN